MLQKKLVVMYKVIQVTLKKDLQHSLLTQATGVQGLLSRTEGIIVNPNLELLFNGPSLRSFGLSYKMSPRNEPESIMIKKDHKNVQAINGMLKDQHQTFS